MATYSAEEVLKKLKQNNISVEEGKRKLTLPLRVGLKLWSYIDFLCKTQGYVWVRKA
jgi:hypothetical protein